MNVFWRLFTLRFWQVLLATAVDRLVDLWQRVTTFFQKPKPPEIPPSGDDTLYLITTIFNPAGYKSRYKLYHDFVGRMRKFKNARVITVELVYGDAPFAVTKANNPDHVQVRTDHPLWHKENLVNIGIAALPPTWQYVSWIDADVHFSSPQWVENTITALKKYQVVQMFSYALDLDAKGNGIVQHVGYALSRSGDVVPQLPRIPVGDRHHPGYAWAVTRAFVDAVGGVFDLGILGSGDWHMACAMTNRVSNSFQPNGATALSSATLGITWLSKDYKARLREWQQKANGVLGGQVGYVPQTLYHHWHGSKKDRQYHERWRILRDNDYSPSADLKREDTGVLQFVGTKPELQAQVLNYFYQRYEDGRPPVLQETA